MNLKCSRCGLVEDTTPIGLYSPDAMSTCGGCRTGAEQIELVKAHRRHAEYHLAQASHHQAEAALCINEADELEASLAVQEVGLR